MTLSTDSLIKRIAQTDTVSLTLYNEYGEAYLAGDLTTLVHSRNKARIRWNTKSQMRNVSPFTYAIIHHGRRIWNVLAIRPVIDPDATEIEMTYEY